MELKNKKEWKRFVKINNDDPYGKCTVDYTRDWAEAMETEMKKNKIDTSNDLAVLSFLEQRAKYLSHKANKPHGITGFMYGCAVQMLAKCWKWGEILRKWHNIDSQIHNEGEKANKSGGTLNPALINIEKK